MRHQKLKGKNWIKNESSRKMSEKINEEKRSYFRKTKEK